MDTDQQPPEAGTVVIELDDHLRDLRDHLLQAVPGLTATAYRGELTLHIEADRIVELLQLCRTDPTVACELLSDLHAVHWPAGVAEHNDQETTGWPTTQTVNADGRIEVDYLLRSIRHGHRFRIRVAVPEDDPVMPSATGVYSAADVMEREAYDLGGVVFTGHPRMTRIMMPDDWEGHPHRKDYPLGGVEVMYKGTTVPPPDERDY
jgi:NADH-quinone oxidoreductase subunit C